MKTYVSTEEHLAAHGRIIDELAGLRELHPQVARMLKSRAPAGFEHHGEYNHHRADFFPLREGLEEHVDGIDLTCVFTRERMELEIVPPLASAEQRKLCAEYEYHATKAASLLARLIEAVRPVG